MRAPLFIVRDSTILGSKADLRLPQAYRSLPRSSSLLEPSHPLGGLIATLLLLKSIANMQSHNFMARICSCTYFSSSKKSSQNTEQSKSMLCHKSTTYYCSKKVFKDYAMQAQHNSYSNLVSITKI